MRGARSIVAFGILFACAGLTAQAASPWAAIADPVFLRIDQRGLPQPSVYAVTQDAPGYIWIGTPGGLARYDGYGFRNYVANAANPQAPSGVEALLADANGAIWIGTPADGLVRLDESNDTFRAWRADPAGRTGPRSASVIALARTRDGQLWIGGDSGLDRFDPRTGTFAPAELTPSGENQPRVEALLVDHRQTVWVATVRGLFYRTATQHSFRSLTPAGDDRFGSRAFLSLYEDSFGRLWAGSLNAVYVIAGSGRIAHTYTSSDTGLGAGEQWGIIEVTPGTFWVGSYDGGIAIVDDASHKIRRIAVDRGNPGGLTPGNVWQFYRDRSGLIWIANGPGGLLAHNPLNRGIFELSSSDRHLGAGDLGARAVAAAPDGALWLGGSDNVVRLEPRSGTSSVFTLPNHPSVQTLLAGADGTLLIGTMRGLCRLPAGDARVECPPGFYSSLGRVFAILEQGNTLWVGSDTGVIARDGRTGKITRYRHRKAPNSLSNDFVTVLYADHAGDIWVGTTNGVNRIEPLTGRIVRITYDPRNSSTLGAGSISSIVEDKRGRIWAGSIGGPLNIIAENAGSHSTVTRLGNAEGVPDNVDGLEVDARGDIWASATNAMARIDPDTLRVRIVGPAEGVQQTEFWTRAVTRSRDGTIFFAGTYAVTVLTPDARAEWHYQPPLVLTGVKIGQRAVPIGSRAGVVSLELPPGERDVSVEFSALDYSAPQALHYAYLLDGYNRAWIDADAAHRVATYTNLSPGDYTLRVRGTNRLGAWSERAIALGVRALPAWYETWWFRALLAILGLGAVFALIRARTAVLRRRAQRLEEIVEERTSELATANAALENMAVTDTLTGLKNRRFFMQRVDDDVAFALRQHTDLLFFLVDIDHFKAVNDEFGHAAGDAVLVQMRDRLESVFRASDYVLRWGGEEFLAVTRGSDRSDAQDIAERLRLAIEQRPFDLDGGRQLAKTASIGFAAFPFVRSSPRAIPWTQVVELADQALYMAKSGGRNTWYGIVATPRTNASELAQQLQRSADDALRDGHVKIVDKMKSGAAP